MFQFPSTRDYWSELLSSPHTSDDERLDVESSSPHCDGTSDRRSLSPPSFGEASPSTTPGSPSELPSTPPPATTDEELARLYGWGGDEDSPTTPMDILHRWNNEIRDALQTNMQPSVAARKRLRKRVPCTETEDNSSISPVRRPK